MKIFALEFSSPRRAAAVVESAPGLPVKVLGEVADRDFRGKSGLMLVQQALDEARVEPAQIDLLAIGRGPGSYTGIRSAIAIAQGWQLGRNTPSAGISTVEVLASQWAGQNPGGKIQIIIDAQRREVYSAWYEVGEGGFLPIRELEIIPAESIREEPGVLVVGPEAPRFAAHGRELLPDPVALASLAARAPERIPAEFLEPIYLRPTAFVKAPPPRIV